MNASNSTLKRAPAGALRYPARAAARRLPRLRIGESGAAYLFLAPWFVGLIGLGLGPVLASLYLSFTNFNLLSPPKLIGLQNYVALIHDARYLDSVKVTLGYVALGVPLKLLAAMALALALNRKLRAFDLYRSIYYIPSLLGASVAIGILWRQVFSSDGLVNQLLKLVGIKGQNWIDSPSFALLTLVVLAVWQFGSPMLIFLAGLRQVPAEMLDAAAVDGATHVRTFFSIVLPLLTPLVLFNLVMQTVLSFQAFTPAFIISDGLGGPIDSTLFYTLYLYMQGFQFFHMGYASAMAWVLLVATAAVTLGFFKTSRY